MDFSLKTHQDMGNINIKPKIKTISSSFHIHFPQTERSQPTNSKKQCCNTPRQKNSTKPCKNTYKHNLQAREATKQKKAKAFGMKWQILFPEYQTQDIRLTFFKCLKWQFEETMDPINCPYHYFCDSHYPGNYPPSVDILVFIFITASYFSTLFTISRKGKNRKLYTRYFLPSGPISLPLIVLALAKGFRVNTVFDMSIVGPAMLQLVQISALSFDSQSPSNLKYILFEASTVSGLLHASLYLDAILLPYYTGLEALTSSSFSGECLSCVCRRDPLVVGGAISSFRGWSVTTFSVAGALCVRIICSASGEVTGKALWVKSLVEGLALGLIAFDCVFMLRNSSKERSMFYVVMFGGLFVLICVHGLGKFCSQIVRLKTMSVKSGVNTFSMESKIEERL